MPLPDVLPLTNGATKLFLPQGGDMTLVMEWAIDEDSSHSIVMAYGAITDSKGKLVLDLASYLEAAEGFAVLHIPAAVTKALAPWGDGRWTVFAMNSAGFTRIIQEGPAKLRESAIGTTPVEIPGVDMAPANFPLDLYQGDTYSWDFDIWTDSAMSVPADLTGVTAYAQIRTAPGAAQPMDLTVTISGNTVTVTLTNDMWQNWSALKAKWDLELHYPGGGLKTIVAGDVTVTPDITVHAGTYGMVVPAGTLRLRTT